MLTDDELNVIESEDVIINPETDFDWYLLNPKNECHLAYSKDYFRAFPNFESYYKEIKKLFTTGNRYIAGYDVSNDVDFVNCACERYKQQFIQFRAFDLKKYLNKVYNTNKKLVEWAEFFECDISSLKSHKSVDDAMMTMLILKKECEKTGKSAEEIFLEYKDFFVSNEQLLFQAEERKYKKELQDKLKRMYNKKAPQPRKNVFNGERFEFDKKLFTDLEFLLDFAKEIYARTKSKTNVKCLGLKTREELENLYSQIDVVIVCSREETLSMTAIEAMMYGKTCIVSDACGIVTYLDGSLKELVYPWDESMELAKRILWCVEHRDELHVVGKEARKIYEKEFSMEIFKSRLQEVISRVELDSKDRDVQ